MRWIFITLVLANAGVFIWYSIESSHMQRVEALRTTSGSEQAVVSGAPLILVSELTEEERHELVSPKRVPVVKVAATAATEVLPEAAPPVAAAPASPAPKETPKEPPKPAVVAAGQTPVVEPNQCLRVGPAASVAQAEQLSQRLMAFTIITDVIDVDAPGKPEYWVILPPFSDEKAALQKMQVLQGRGIPAQIIPKGDLANAISFGLHGQIDEANKQAEELNAKGFKVIVKAVPVIHKEKWLALSERQAPKLTEELWQGIHADFPKITKQVKNCH